MRCSVLAVHGTYYAYPEALAVDQIAQVTQGGEILVQPVQRIAAAADGDEGLLALPNEGQDRVIFLQAGGQEGLTCSPEIVRC